MEYFDNLNVYGPHQWHELLQREAAGLTVADVEWPSAITGKEDVRRPNDKDSERERTAERRLQSGPGGAYY